MICYIHTIMDILADIIVYKEADMAVDTTVDTVVYAPTYIAYIIPSTSE